jgi:hypothetical protein
VRDVIGSEREEQLNSNQQIFISQQIIIVELETLQYQR